MKDSEHLQREIEDAEKMRVKIKHPHEHAECELCGIIGRVVDGLCVSCREKYKLWERQ